MKNADQVGILAVGVYQERGFLKNIYLAVLGLSFSMQDLVP